MRLERFRISNFRSVNDSGWIDVSGTTAFVGRNECGKTNLLQALVTLNDDVVPSELSRMRDFPADRLHNQYSDALDVVRTTWILSEEERRALTDLLPDAQSVERVEVGRGYKSDRWVRFVGLPEPELPNDRVCELLTRVHAVPAETGAAPDPSWWRGMAALTAAAKRRCEDPRAWASELSAALAGLQTPLQSGNMVLGDDAVASLEEIAEISMQVASEPEFENVARDWALRRLPRLLYLDQYPDIEGSQNLADFAARQRDGKPEAGDPYFAMLLRVSGIEPTEVEELLSADPEMRRQIASRAGAVLTRTLRRIWTDRALKVRFNIDGDQFNTLVSDPTSFCDVEVNLNQRSRGFRWFFSFYVMFASGEQDGTTSETVLLLDEPGLHLHALGQRDLLNHLASDLDNQVLLATQSPFMLPESTDSAVRYIESNEDSGTIAVAKDEAENTLATATLAAFGAAIPSTVETSSPANDSDADSEGASPEAELVLHEEVETTSETTEEQPPAADPDLDLLVDTTPALLLETMTDYWYLLAASDYLESQGRTGLPKGLALTPIGGAARSPVLRRRLGCGTGDVFVLASELPDELEYDGDSQNQAIWIGEGLDPEARADAACVDVEDLLSPDLYHRFVCFGYREQLGDEEPKLDGDVANIVERYDSAFCERNLEFRRTRVARLILKGAFKNPDALMTEASANRFERLFEAIASRF